MNIDLLSLYKRIAFLFGYKLEFNQCLEILVNTPVILNDASFLISLLRKYLKNRIISDVHNAVVHGVSTSSSVPE